MTYNDFSVEPYVSGSESKRIINTTTWNQVQDSEVSNRVRSVLSLDTLAGNYGKGKWTQFGTHNDNNGTVNISSASGGYWSNRYDNSNPWGNDNWPQSGNDNWPRPKLGGGDKTAGSSNDNGWPYHNQGYASAG